jgi:V8-like Glu-specific endopeptidase
MKNGKWNVLSALLVSCILLFNPTGVSFAQDEKPVQKLLLRMKPGVVLIGVIIDEEVNLGGKKYNNEIFETGSGFLISPDGYLVTNGHVVEDYQESNENRLEFEFFVKVLSQYFVHQTDKSGRPYSEQHKQLELIKLYHQYRPFAKITIKRDLKVALSNGEIYAAEVKQYSPPITPGMIGKAEVGTQLSIPGTEIKRETGKDVAVLKIEGRDLPVVQLGDSGNLQLGDTIYVIGYPGVVNQHEYLSKRTVFDSTITSGHVSGSKLDVKGTPVIQTDAALTWGNSGGPAFNSKGEVIGIATFISISQNLGSQQAVQGFNFLVPVNTAKEFVRATGIDLNVQSLFNKLWSEALDLYSIADYKKTLNKIDELNRLLPNLPDVKKLQISAQEKISTQKSGLPLVPIMIAVLGVILVGGIVFFVILRGKEKKSSAPASAPSILSQQTKAAAPASSLRCTEGPLAGRSFPITSSGIKIGRDSNKNQVVVDNDGVSREHAWVGMENGKVIVKDLNSLNGTYLNSTDTDRIKSEPLKDGDVIIIGKGRFAVLSYKAA